MPFLVIAIIIAVGAIAAYTVRILLMEKKAANAPPEEADTTDEAEDLLKQYGIESSENELFDLVEHFGVPLPDEEGDSRQNSEQAEIIGRMHDIALYDSLCDVKVGPPYIAECKRAIAESSGKWAVACIDFDRFRYINSLKGMSIGDMVLIGFANSLRAIFPEEALITRTAADHFSVCFPLGEDSMLEHYAEVMKEACEKIRNDIGSKGVIRACMGVCVSDGTISVADLSDDGDIGKSAYRFSRNYDVMYYKANIARHCLKVSKFENMSRYDDTMATTFLYGESALENYSENQYDEEITPYFQPQSDITKSRIVAAQALLRWTFEELAHKDRGGVHPELGRMPSGASRMIYQVCLSISRWRKNGKEIMPVLVYLPPNELYKEDIDDYVAKCVSEFQLEPQVLTMVIDISAFLIAPNIAKMQIQKLSDIGAKIAVDGFIYGEGRVEMLEGLPIDYIKIPRELTSGIDRYPDRNAYLMGFQNRVLRLGMKPIYEGIDETAQMNAIAALGGTLVEGRYSGRPIGGEDFSRVLKEFVHKQRIIGDNTVILEVDELQRGDYHV